jgi:hypothetical protein
MNPRHGKVWLVDMGIAGKTRPQSFSLRLCNAFAFSFFLCGWLLLSAG